MPTSSTALPTRPGLHRLSAYGGMAALVLVGANPGPTLVVSAGIHGDEYEGVRAIFETLEAIAPTSLRGRILAAPIVNWPAHRAATRHHPEDGANLARVFPGRADGTPSEQLAWRFDQFFLAHADFYLDLHSGGIRFAMPSMVGYASADPRARHLGASGD
jgi:uncharacterized protein